jgi:hypothetical protein
MTQFLHPKIIINFIVLLQSNNYISMRKDTHSSNDNFDIDLLS